MKTPIKILFQCFVLSLSVGCATQTSKVEDNPEEVETPINQHSQKTNEIIDPVTTQTPEPETKPVPVIQTGRYTAVPATPTLPQREPLQVMITVTIPNELQTVGQAAHYLLKRSGYRLDNSLDPKVIQLFFNPLPDVQRHLGPMTLEDALTVLVTPAFVPVADSIRRTINYVPVTQNTNNLDKGVQS